MSRTSGLLSLFALRTVFCLTAPFAIPAITGDVQRTGFGHGTAVVVLRSPKAIYAAADSKELFSEYRDGKVTVDASLMCKVRRLGPYYSIVAGVVRATNGFDALGEVSRVYRPGDDLDQLTAATSEALPRALDPVLRIVHDSDPEAFARTYATQPALQLALMGTERNTPKVVVIEFQVVESGRERIALSTRINSCPGNCPHSSIGYFLGTHAAMEQSVRRHPAILSRPDEQGVEKLIGLEYDNRPDIVGGPVSMLRIDPTGSTMLRGGACAPR